MNPVPYLRLSAFICGAVLGIGCKTVDGPTEARKTQDAALQDPYSYGPDAKSMQNRGKEDDVDRTDIGGGSTSELNKKALKRDWDSFWGN